MAATEQLPAEEALRRSEHRYRNLFQAMAASFWELDFFTVGGMLRDLKAQGVRDFPAYLARNPEVVRAMMHATRVIDVNDKTVQLFGGETKDDLFVPLDRFWPEESNAVYAASVIAAISGQPNFITETRLRKLDGSLIDSLFTVAFPLETMNKGTLLVGVLDLTEMKRTAAEAERLRAEFAHAARVSMLGELTASIAHEINQPLAAIATNAAAGLRWLGRDEPDVEEVRALTHRIADDARRAADIVSRIRAMAAHQTPERTALSINGVVEEALLFLAHEIQGRQAAVMLDLTPGLPPVMGDRTQLQQVVVNLAMNALQAMDGEARRLGVTTRLEAGAVEIAVLDSGPGLGAAGGRLFDSFYSTKPGGLGLGLPISRSIIEAHGGSIEAADAPGGGARFIVRLPIY